MAARLVCTVFKEGWGKGMKEEKNKKDHYDPARSGSFAVLRAAIAAYLIWLGYGIVRDALTGAQGQVPLWVLLFGILFIIIGAAFAVYAWRRYRRETAYTGSDEQTENKEPSEGDQ